MPRISVIIPAYNSSDFIRETIESVLKQSFADIEVLAVDDGSTDNTRSVLNSINDNRIKYFFKLNGGGSSARNFGLIKSQSEYIALLDHDDLWPPDYLKIMIRRLEEKPEYGMAYSQFTDVCNDGSKVLGFGSERYRSGWLTKDFFGKVPLILPSATVYRKSVFTDFFFDESLAAADTDFFLRLSTKTQFLCVPEVSVTRRKVPTSETMIMKEKGHFSLEIALIFERFYFQLGGKEIVPPRMAKHKISRFYRSNAREHRLRGHRNVAIQLLKKAINYYPFDPHYYRDLLKALLLSRKDDKLPHWQMPKPLPSYITVNQKLDKNRTSI